MLPKRIQLVSTDTNATYQPLFPDETISSWAKRNSVHLTPVPSEESDRDYGALQFQLPGASRELLTQLHYAARTPDPWMLRPHQRTLKCTRCLAEDWARGLSFYDRRAWAVAWRTCCAEHGPLHDADWEPVPSWTSVLERSVWTRQGAGLLIKRPFRICFAIPLYDDRRAVHLEAALAEGREAASWFPRGLDEESLRFAYRKIIEKLLDQFFVCDECSEELPAPAFNRALNNVRFTLNVFAEAILSQWTNTPLPGCASAQRTALVVRAIGWGKSEPDEIRTGQILFRGEIVRPRTRSLHEALFPTSLFGLPVLPATHDRFTYFKLSEARQLGLDVHSRLSWLADLTRKGQFLALDLRGGHLTRNRALPDAFRLDYEAVAERGVRLPAWACASPKPAPRTADLYRAEEMGRFWPPEAWRRHMKKGRRKCIRFDPAAAH